MIVAKRKRHLILTICIIIPIGTIAIFNMFLPRAIVEDSNTSHVTVVQYNPYFNQEKNARIEIVDYNEKGILDCLSGHTEQRTLNSVNSAYWIGNVELELTINTQNGFKNIVLGNENYSYEGYGKPKYKILDSDNLKSALLEMMHIEAES